MIYGNGMTQEDLVTLLTALKTKHNAILAKLDADGGVADTNYAALHAVALSSNVQAAGVNLDDVYTFLTALTTKFNAVLAKLDADGTVNSTDYASALGVTFPAGVYTNGMLQGMVVNYLNVLIGKIAALNAKLDADTGVSGTNYAATCNVTDTVDEAGTTAN